MKTIIHCMSEAVWNEIQNQEFYVTPTLDKEGFIHCSDVDTLHRVADYMFTDDKESLILLCIDTSIVKAEVVWEDLYNDGTDYPHIYGPLNLDAVTAVLPFLRNTNGKFVLNEELSITKSSKSQKSVYFRL